LKKITLLVFLLFSLILTACVNDENNASATDKPVKLMISAATSLTAAMEEIQVLYESQNDVELTFNLGGSGSLAQKIQQGAPVDVFISANLEWMDALVRENLIIGETREEITGNKLVLITGNNSPINYESIDDISAKDIDQIAIGNPESVPAGMYSQQLLHTLDIWDSIEDKLVLAKDVRQVLTYVETGNVDIGFIYESDALTSKSIKVLATVEDGLHDPIIYPAAVLIDTKHENEASDFVEFMASDEAQMIFVKHGFRK